MPIRTGPSVLPHPQKRITNEKYMPLFYCSIFKIAVFELCSYVHSHMHTATHTRTATHTCTATHTATHTCTQPHIHAQPHTHTHTHMHTTTRTQPHTHCQTCIDNKSAKISSPHAVSISSPPIAIFNIG